MAHKQIKCHNYRTDPFTDPFREIVINLLSRVSWSFGSDKAGKFNSKYWSRLMVVKTGASYSDAVGDLFKNPSLYQTGCKNTSMLILLNAILDTVGGTEFNNRMKSTGTAEVSSAAQQSGLLKVDRVTPGGASPTLRDWVPGDRGYIEGSGMGLGGGEWIIYMGQGDHFWGWDSPVHSGVSLSEMMDSVRNFSTGNGQASETGQRWYSGVGLQ